MRTSQIFLFIFISILFISCQDTDNEILEMRVSHHKQIGYGFIGPRISFVIQVEDEIGGDEWRGTFGITDFEYEWGYTYDIAVVKDYFNYDGPVADAPEFRFVFLKELSKRKVTSGTQFELILQRTFENGIIETFWEADGENGYQIVGDKSFDCNDLCDDLTKQQEPYTVLEGTFEHLGEGEIKLVDLKSQYFK
ncbi:MAG: hypothetical protein GVY07_09945 [Bacteroidetes bacterium]|jgi:hypothetical protein|nr:hypothetical protein [Bacteroidota bacterium]